MTALPDIADFTASTVTEAEFKTAQANLVNFLSGLFGTTGTQATALTTLGSLGAQISAKAGAYTVLAADRGKMFHASGTWSLSFTAAATLGSGFSFGVINTGSGDITLDPAGTEQINGATTIALKAGASAIVTCNGTAFHAVVASNEADPTFTIKSATVTSSVAWTTFKSANSIPDSVTTVGVIAASGGGGGGGGAGGNVGGGGGGGGGGAAGGMSIGFGAPTGTITVGAGGTGGSAGPSNPSGSSSGGTGGTGGTSSFIGVSVVGGAGGYGGSSMNGGSGRTNSGASGILSSLSRLTGGNGATTTTASGGGGGSGVGADVGAAGGSGGTGGNYPGAGSAGAAGGSGQVTIFWVA